MYTNKTQFKNAFKQKVMQLFGKSLKDASMIDKYVTLATMVRDMINQKWVNTNDYYLDSGQRQVYYFSLEFLLGKFLESNLIYSGCYDICREGLKEIDIDLDEIIACEPDAGLGNGGLGRLAACFLDSMASIGLPGHGCGIRYKYGLFSQKIIDGYQVELPDNWLRDVNAWEVRKPDKAVIVKFHGDVECEFIDGDYVYKHVNYMPVLAVPFDMPIMGYENSTVNTLRLFSAEAAEASFDFASFSRGDYMNAVSNKYSVEAISEVLYPDDSNYSNRLLRLKQQYFFVSAGLQCIVRRFKKKKSLNIRELPDKITIHINDTHPALAVPELMRILIDEEGFGWDEAWDITTKTIAYTNHTILPEALETWPVDLFRNLLPRIYMIVEEINRRFCLEINRKYPGDQNRINNMAIIGAGSVRMANLAVVGSYSVNGVAAVHSELLKTVVMRDFYDFYPAKFNNKTNGITHRRWLLKSNQPLSRLITECIGDKWIRQPLELEKLTDMADDPAIHEKLIEIKRENKARLSDYVLETLGVKLDPDSIFDVQVKRIHAYKRQLLNALHILHIYNLIKDDPSIDIHPHTFIFAGKAAPSYYYAKNIIKLINELGNLINNDPAVNSKIKLVFLPNYNISLAELIFPASEVSQQISTATKEASGTGNMKFMMNGAITLGTMDGANIEISDYVGPENFVQFGLTVDEVLDYHKNGGYNSYEYFEHDSRIFRIINELTGNLLPHVPRDEFNNITRSLLEYNDEFFVLRDFASYADAHRKIDGLYRDKTKWNRMSLINIAKSGRFSSDNTIAQYASEIWHIKPCCPPSDE